MSQHKFNRVEVGGHTTVRFFVERRAALGDANLRTKAANEQHTSAQTAHGYLVINTVTKKLYDIDGEVPEKAAKEIFVA